MASERYKPKPEQPPPPVEKPGIHLSEQERLTESLDKLGIPYECINGHIYSSMGFHHTCDKLIEGGMRQIHGEHFCCHYQSGRVIKVRKDKVLDKHTLKYVEKVTIY